jgi:hypothetical protein
VGDADDGQRVAFIRLFCEDVDGDKIEFERRRHVDRVLKGDQADDALSYRY